MPDNRPLIMEIHIGDFRRETSRLPLLQYAAFHKLLVDYWDHGPPPDDHDVLAQIVGVTVDEWEKLRHPIGKLFEIKGGFWHHEATDKQIAKAQSRIAKRRKAANARWRDHISEKINGNAYAYPNGHAPD